MTRTRHLTLVPPLPQPCRDEGHVLGVVGLLARSGALGAEPMDWAAKQERMGTPPRDLYTHPWEALDDLQHRNKPIRKADDAQQTEPPQDTAA